MIAQTISSLNERGGSSRAAILEYVLRNFNVGDNETAVNSRVELTLKAGVKAAKLLSIDHSSWMSREWNTNFPRGYVRALVCVCLCDTVYACYVQWDIKSMLSVPLVINH